MFDRDRAPWLVLQDASGDVAALCSTSQQNNAVIAQVAAQWTWDAYGNVFSADHIAPHPFMRVGHKGLFVERLDTGVADASVPGADYVETPRLVPFARLVYHNRNRSYSPEHGRFLQADPNASGSLVVSSLSMHGNAVVVASPMLDLSTRYLDGPNIYQYVNSTPWMRSDPTGLFGFDIGMTYAEVGMSVGALAFDLVSVYAMNQESDADWASDWELPDDFHTRGDASWIDDIYSTHDIDGVVDSAVNPFASADMAVARGTRGFYQAGTRILRGARRAGYHGHHAFFRTLTKWRSNVKEILVGLPPNVHRQYHKFVDQEVKRMVPGAPSIWNPGGERVWAAFMKDPANKKAYFDALIAATANFEAHIKKTTGVLYPLVKSLKEAMGV